MKKRISNLLLAIVLVGSFSKVSTAGIITWGNATNSSGVTDVIVDGIVVEAINATVSNIGSILVNGVTFNNSTDLLNQGGSINALNGNSTGDAGYDALLDSFDFGNGPNLVSLPVGAGSLVSGHDYLIQVWYTDLRSATSGRNMLFGDGNNNTVTLNASTGGFGQFAIGSFSAASQNLTLDAQGFANAHISGYQIRDVTVVSAPATLALVGLGFAGLGFARRNRA